MVYAVSEQKMIESLAEHGVDPMDLVPSLMTTHTIKNPEYDPEEVKRKELAEEMERVRLEEEEQQKRERKEKGEDLEDTVADADEPPPPPYARTVEEGIAGEAAPTSTTPKSPLPPPPPLTPRKFNNPFGDDDEDEDEMPKKFQVVAGPSTARLRSGSIATTTPRSVVESDGDLATFSEDLGDDEPSIDGTTPQDDEEEEESTTPKANPPLRLPGPPEDILSPRLTALPPELPPQSESKALPGVSTSLSKTDENVTLDIRWTIVSCVGGAHRN
jgi:hypothetical protein